MLEVTTITGLKGLHIAVFDVDGIPEDMESFQKWANRIIDHIETWNLAFNIDAARVEGGAVRFNVQMDLRAKKAFQKRLNGLRVMGKPVKVR